MEDSSTINTMSSTAKTPNPPSSQTSSSWWSFGGLIEKVKQQSESIVKIYKEDLKEFTSTISEDTKEAIKKTADEKEMEKLTSQITSGISGLFAFNGGKEGGKQPTQQNKRVIVDRHQARVIALQTELSTYCTEPSDQDDFLNWKKEFKVSSHTDDISQLLAVNDKIREIHTKLVPVAVSYTDFWERYYYKLHKLNQEEERRAALVKRATTSGHNDDEDLSWDEEDDAEPKPKSDIPKREVEEYLEKLDTTSDGEVPSKSESSGTNSAPETPTPVRAEAPIVPEPSKVEEKVEKVETVVKEAPVEAPAQPAPSKQAKTPQSAKKSADGEEEWDNWE